MQKFFAAPGLPLRLFVHVRQQLFTRLLFPLRQHIEEDVEADKSNEQDDAVFPSDTPVKRQQQREDCEENHDRDLAP